MKILAIETSAKAASVCLCEDEFLIAQSYQNSGLTHSQTILPMCESMLKHCGVALKDVTRTGAGDTEGAACSL